MHLHTNLFMRRFFLYLILLISVSTAQAQFNNEWIDYSKTYYKFRVGKNGLYRISQSTLQANGLGNIPVQNFQLWRNGEEVPMYTSIATGILNNGDYLEFYGIINDGKPDKELYRDPSYQIYDRVSLQTDSSTYFLTYNSSGNNARMNLANNNVAGNNLSPEPFFMHTEKIDFRNQVSGGYSEFSNKLYSSSYDLGEMVSTSDLYAYNNVTLGTPNFYPYMQGNNLCTVKIGVGGVTFNTRSVTLKINSTTIGSIKNLNNFDTKVFQFTQPSGIIPSGKATVNVIDTCRDQYDRIIVSFVDITYPRLFNFDNQNIFEFELPAHNGKYLEISNFNKGSNALPILYDLTNHQCYIAAINNSGVLQFVLPSTNTPAKYVLLSRDNSNINTILSLKQRNFIDYSSPINQGNYLIISNAILYQPVNGQNAIEQYRQYRNSQQGGSYNTKIYDIDQLEDQFAYGIKKHPSSVRNFLRYTRKKFNTPPQFALLIGKAVNYKDYRFNQNNSDIERLNLVPTFGYPASDILLSSNDNAPYPATPIGRISAISGQEVLDYLEKVKEYESKQNSNSNLQVDKLWMKNIIHVIGAENQGEANAMKSFFDANESVIKDTLFGGNVTTFNKFNVTAASTINNDLIGNLFEKGHSLLSYIGHSSSTKLDYNLENPYAYNNPGKYPIMLLLGCSAGDFFQYDPLRLTSKNSISENYVLAKNRGSVGVIAGSSIGLLYNLGEYSRVFYRSVGYESYNKPIGKILQNVLQDYLYKVANLGSDFYRRIHSEQLLLHGDPALKMNSFTKPDFSVEEQNIVFSSNFISVADNTVKTKIYYYNLGKATNDSITIEVKRQYPPSNINPVGSTEILIKKKILSTDLIDSIEIQLPIIANRDKGTNKIIVSLDAENTVDEISETNNIASKDFAVFEDEIKPMYPENFSIVNKQNIKLIGTTANPFATTKVYRMELDTTELFNSPIKISKDIIATGGITEFEPRIDFRDSTVYYWRLGVVPVNGSSPLRWNISSFIYLANSSTGYNQSHLFQHLKSYCENISIDSITRRWNFSTVPNTLLITQSVYPISGFTAADFTIAVNGYTVAASICQGHSLVFNLFDSISFRPISNLNHPYGSISNYCSPGDTKLENNFEWDDRDTTNRHNIIRFMDAIPNGTYVVVRKFLHKPYNLETIAPKLLADTANFGSGISIYHKLKEAGFNDIDSFNRPRVWAFVYKKNDKSFKPMWKFSQDMEKIELSVTCKSYDTAGYITSPAFGPATAWKSVKWAGNTSDTKLGDKPTINVVGISNAGIEKTLYTLSENQKDFDISAISAKEYPYLKLQMRNADPINATPFNLKYWRILYDPVPEGSLAANILFKTKDTLDIGEPYNFSIAFKNISDIKFRDSIKIKATVLDQNNVPHIIPISKKRDIPAGDTATIKVQINTKDYPGVNNLFIDVNPDNDQPEVYHFNNFLYRDFFVRPDNYNPLLDVTFDGVHILNRDIVSARPHIQIKLKDESKWLALNDTSLINLTLTFPDGSTRTYNFGTDTLHFTPADVNSGNNTATIDFYPDLNQDSQDKDYQLSVSGKDVSGNKAGAVQYAVNFQVFNKPMISNLFNYPNPFTTSTAFVFTITGKEIPQEFKIQILTVTGKIVREITRQELGSLHIGHNITEYKWDGTDQFGAKLANGVYLYRVVTGLDGKKLDHFRINDNFDQQMQDQTDKYFTKGYGKMYLMR